MKTTEQTTPQAPGVNPDVTPAFDNLPTLDKAAWLRRAEYAIKTLAPAFAPRFCSLSYLDPFHARLALLNADGNGHMDAGIITLSEPEE